MAAAAAPRLSPRVIDAILRIDDGSLPIAEVNRRVGERAEALGFARPSYEHVRRLVHEGRRRRRWPSTTSVLLDVAFRARPIDAMFDHMAGGSVPIRRSYRPK